MHQITILGLGPDDTDYLTKKAVDTLHSSKKLVLRTKQCAAARYLERESIAYESMDHLYDTAQDFESLEQSIADAVIRLAQEEPVTYAVPGAAVYGDGTVDRLLSCTDNIEIIPGLPGELQALSCGHVHGLSSGLTVIPAAILEESSVNTRLPLLITALDDPYTLSGAKLILSASYGDEHPVILLQDNRASVIKLYELDRAKSVDHNTCLYLSPRSSMGLYDFQDLMDVFAKLRSPDGCPWDREQTHTSLKRYLIEETAEALDAIDNGDMTELCDELGDVLLQVAFHAQIADERGDFDLVDVCDNLCRKLIERHPHVFSDRIADTPDDVVKTWDEIKKAKRKQKSEATIMSEVPRHLSALIRADKVQQRAAKVGFDWEDANGALDKLSEEIKETLDAYHAGDHDHAKKELGDVLFAAVNVCRLLGVEGEFALDETTKKFIRRFTYIEQKSLENGKELREMSLREMDKLWEESKALEKSC